MKKAITDIKKGRSRILGTGLVALDVVLAEGNPAQYFAGGTCGNVLAILAHLGWAAVPLARIGRDRASSIVRSDLERWGVDLSLLSVPPTTKTPVIVQRLRKDVKGIPFHTFSCYCPGCGRRLPGFQPLTLESLPSILPHLKDSFVLFIDRVSPSSLALARQAVEENIVVFFEPPSASDDKNFRALLDCATIVKYSHDRIDELDTAGSRRLLEIQTMGRGGLRFRTKLADFGDHWHHLDAQPILNLIDSAGAGDWLSVGLIQSACQGGLRRLSKLSRTALLRSLALGQSLAAWNCGFIGARGGMYDARVDEIPQIVKSHLIESTKQSATHAPRPDFQDFSQVCESCKDASKIGTVNRTRSRIGT